MTRNPIQTPRIWDYGYLFVREYRRALRRIFPLPGERLLDVGCGEQPHRKLYDVPGRTITTLDPNPNLKGVDVVGKADALPFDDHTYDIVTVFTSLQSVDDPAQSMREIARVLKPGGFAIICEHQQWHVYSEWDRYRFSKYGLIHLGEQAGMETNQVVFIGTFWMRTIVRVNRALDPYQNSPWRFLRWPAALLITALNLAYFIFALFDRARPMDGEAIGHVVVLKKSG